MDIGYPVDVNHAAHIGCDGPSESASSWMNGFNLAADFSTSIGNPIKSNTATISSWSSRDFDQALRLQSHIFQGIPTTDIPDVPKRQKRRKKSPSSKSSFLCSRLLQEVKSQTTRHELEPT